MTYTSDITIEPLELNSFPTYQNRWKQSFIITGRTGIDRCELPVRINGYPRLKILSSLKLLVEGSELDGTTVLPGQETIVDFLESRKTSTGDLQGFRRQDGSINISIDMDSIAHPDNRPSDLP